MSAAVKSSYKPNDGDWVCPDPQCGNVNFARRTQCNKCGVDKLPPASGDGKKGGTEIGKAMAEKSKGLFSADDWQCKTCGNVNWARRNSCNMCNAPKFGKIEQRTGYGGGYMERDEVVEYVKREEDDSEYDDFGRLKKKRRDSKGPSAQGSQICVPSQSNEREEEEEEEEEDDDEGNLDAYRLDDDEDDDDEDVDLAQYALDSDDALEIKKGAKDPKPADLTSRSRSKSRSSRSYSSRSSRSRSSSSRSRSRSRSYSRSSSKWNRSHRSRSRSRSRDRKRRYSRSSSRSRSKSRDRSKKSRRRSRSRSRSRH